MTRATTFRTGTIERGNEKIIDAYQNHLLTGKGNETAKMQTIIDDASRSGKKIILPPFLIEVDTVILPEAGVRIEGQLGTWPLGGGGIPISGFRSSGVNQPVVQVANAITRRSELTNVFILGTNGGTNQHGFYTPPSGISALHLDRVYVESCGGSGFKLEHFTFSTVLNNCHANLCDEHLFDIDAFNSPCMMLLNCYASRVASGKYGYYVRRGEVYFLNCNGVDFGERIFKIGDQAIGVAHCHLEHCNMEAFSQIGVEVDFLSDLTINSSSFITAAGAVDAQALYMVQPRGNSLFGNHNSFLLAAGANWKNNHPIHLFRGILNCPTGKDPQIPAGTVFTFYNDEFAREDPLANQHNRVPTVSVGNIGAGGTYTEERVSAGYIGVNNPGVTFINLFDPASTDCYDGRTITVKDESGAAAANNIAISTVNGRNMDGVNVQFINTNYGVMRFIKRGNQYWII